MATSAVPKLFGSYTFGDSVMKERLPKAVYKSLRATIDEGAPLDLSVADEVATAMKDWAVELGATHYTHWFQPLTNITAEKHDSFINGTEDGRVLMEFSGKELIKAEPDASSFPSGGLRATCSARGYTAWDCTSPAFVKDTPSGTKVLCIPAAFTSYTGESLDNKTPLLRSMDAVDKQAKRLLALFGKTTTRVKSSVGPEQEYFLVDKEKYQKREDLILCGRTLFGAMPPKGQELDDNYFASIKDKILVFMNDLNDELWKYGILAKTQHNEVAPGQCEIAPIYSDTNIATDNNQLLMEILKKVADRDGLECLCHEKPYLGINGSGKHNNWSMATAEGENLLEPTDNPEDNYQFLLVLSCIMEALDENSELLRASASSCGNDHRLGANEAPPAIISAYLGEQLGDIVEQIIEKGSATAKVYAKTYDSGVTTLPKFKMDATDRNRTSPFAFTGNKFEFRMVGSTQPVSQPCTVLNAIIANAMCNACDEIEKAEDKDAAIKNYVQKTLKAHQRVIFNGNGYSDEWVTEATKRNLPNIKCMVDAVPYYKTEKTVQLFEKMGVMSKVELEARAEVLYENYAKYINIEALTMIDMAKKQIIPAVLAYEGTLAKEAADISKLGVVPSVQNEMVANIASKVAELKSAVDTLSAKVEKASELEEDIPAWAKYYHDEIFMSFDTVRKPADELESIVSKDAWPIPTYKELLFEI